MKRVLLPVFAMAAMFAMTADLKAGLLDRMLGGGCCQPSCCEATCAAAEPACGCAAEPACGCAAAPACEPSCGCAPSSCCDTGCGKCCRWTPVRDFLANLHSRCRSRCRSCCDSGCCEATCGCAAEPACGCAH